MNKKVISLKDRLKFNEKIVRRYIGMIVTSIDAEINKFNLEYPDTPKTNFKTALLHLPNHTLNLIEKFPEHDAFIKEAQKRIIKIVRERSKQ
jgi:hypothetical protein